MATGATACDPLTDGLAASVPPVVFVVGQTRPPYDGTVWELVGVFSGEELAVAACMDADYFVMPVQVDSFAPGESVVHFGSWYPATMQRPTAVWYCEACGVEDGIHIDQASGAVDGAHLVHEAHARRSPACRVEGTRRIRVRRLRGGADDGRRTARAELIAAS